MENYKNNKLFREKLHRLINEINKNDGITLKKN